MFIYFNAVAQSHGQGPIHGGGGMIVLIALSTFGLLLPIFRFLG